MVKLDFVDPNVVRVRMEPSGVAFNTNASFVVVKNWVLPPITVVDGNPLTVTHSGPATNPPPVFYRVRLVQ